MCVKSLEGGGCRTNIDPWDILVFSEVTSMNLLKRPIQFPHGKGCQRLVSKRNVTVFGLDVAAVFSIALTAFFLSLIHI